MMRLQRTVRLVAIIPLTLAITAGLPGPGFFHGTTIGHAQHASSAGVGTRLRLKHNGRIAFVLNNPTGAWIETTNPDGTGVERFTQVCGYYLCGDVAYAWSPDGTRMALWRDHNLTPPCSRKSCASTPATVELSLVVINANGTGEKQLARRVGRCYGRACLDAFVSPLSWSPDGKQIVFPHPASHCSPRRPSCEDSLYIVNTTTGRTHRLTRCAAGAYYDTMPTWSPDGTRVALQRNQSLFVVNANGSGLRRLPVRAAVQDPTWSPDGTSIAFDSRDQIYTIHPDGSSLERLTRFSQGAGTPVWSPDGRRIAFFRNPVHRGATTGELWVTRSNGSHPRRLYSQSIPLGEPERPVWSPDGKHIVFDSNRPTKEIQTFYGISVIDANGGHLHVLVTSGEAPAWQPVP